MNEKLINSLKESLREIKIKQNELKRAKNKKERKDIESEIEFLKQALISNYKLTNYDQHIRMESYNNDYFIFDVESILSKLE